ncbi:RNA-binding S4 domain-containing protein [Azospirillum sp. RWY-5-1]|uniref:RNA-binding S4 domain-containing protein n=1 Tax=Azospirillum oleiclasticum TaxID=2735135 RepID=A0ABX2TJJ4_9PROT|nr:RNA-binding S4 domain-containing protein [Azospirillum oleiclasticum]NYZ16010.1 RNA-binding S4 domain-containing protein [Azospirillum oleiclasticum]NYZ23511.1 RNA-binding S4 domain-containing protein [Azospirillum oleiclasticum]
MAFQDERDDTPDDGLPDPGAGRLRLDKWLWYARFLKTRSLAAKLCASGALRCSGTVVTKAHHAVKPGDVLTFPQGRHIRVIRIRALGLRRGPAPEAQTLYEDLSPPAPETALPHGGGERPTKRDRRALERLRGEE